ncbi:MAG TPA: phosphate ABC transporter ATP-binding protein PstB [Candidatus Rifleibacterium sp.]|nr:phosphate ABC transporter ATP-binding protein PstB [Candidatus Rifleibacterium sp.]
MNHPTIIEAQNLNFFYGEFHALKNINIRVQEHRVTALIGPSGCGKSTMIRVMNRMSDLVPESRATGLLSILGRDIFAPASDVTELRRNVGMVFQQPNPFSQTIFDNLVFGLRIAGENNRQTQMASVEECLTAVDLWKDLKDRLNAPAVGLSADFQQRLCIARAIAIKPSILLMDEPCSSLDPVATQRIEELIFRLKDTYTILIVTHSMQQAARISDFTGFLMMGELIEFAETAKIFRSPADQRTEDYISGKFG